MLVYRLERNNYGVFCEYESQISLNFPDDALFTQYGYTCKQKYRGEDDYRSACDSIDQLIDYFGSDFAYALERGADIVQYNVNKKYVDIGTTDADEHIELVFDSTKVKDRIVVLKGIRR